MNEDRIQLGSGGGSNLGDTLQNFFPKIPRNFVIVDEIPMSLLLKCVYEVSGGALRHMLISHIDGSLTLTCLSASLAGGRGE